MDRNQLIEKMQTIKGSKHINTNSIKLTYGCVVSTANNRKYCTNNYLIKSTK